MNIKMLILGGVGVLAVGASVASLIVALCLLCGTDIPMTSLDSPASTENATQRDVQVGTAIGQRLPDVQFSALDGTPMQLQQLPEKPTVLYFSAVWCASCRYEVDELAKLKNQWGEKVNIVYVDTTPQTDTPEDVRNFAQEFGHPDFLWTLDNRENPAVVPLKVFGLGTAYLLDAQRRVAFRGMNSISTDKFQEIFLSLME